MIFEPANLYHIYNRGNNKNTIFFNRGNYLFFLKKVKELLCPCGSILAYCLMPNHFHFLVFTLENYRDNDLNKAIGILLRSYTRAINIQENRTGSLFQQSTKAKSLTDHANGYPDICFNYIHQNPLKAGLVNKMEDWEFSSFKDYLGLRNGSLPDYKMVEKFINYKRSTFYEDSYSSLDMEKVKNIF
jgi:putative transposase